MQERQLPTNKRKSGAVGVYLEWQHGMNGNQIRRKGRLLERKKGQTKVYLALTNSSTTKDYTALTNLALTPNLT